MLNVDTTGGFGERGSNQLPRYDEQDLNDRIALYLDPMRHRTRWEVIKDFVLPLAAWLGVAVSL